jgi:photosystem II stability/assembly factor-like uncharacterized protein
MIIFSLFVPVVTFSSTQNFALNSAHLKPLTQTRGLAVHELANNALLTSPASSTLLSSSWIPVFSQGITSNSSFVWGAPPFSGRVTAIAVNGSNTNEIFVGAAQGGVWRSLDGGSTWSPLLDGETSLAVGAIALSPDNKVIYVGTGEGNSCGDCSYGIGVLKSLDGGSTWTLHGTSAFNGLGISSLVVNPLNPNELMLTTNYASCCGNEQAALAATNGGIWLSSDGGATWSQMLTGGGFSQIALVPHSSTNFPISGDFAGDAYVYSNTANQSDWATSGHWSAFFNETSSGVDPNCYSSSLCRVVLSSTASNPNYAYLAASNSSDELATMGYCDVTAASCTLTNINRPSGSIDQTGTFQVPCSSPGQADYDQFFAVNPNDKNNLYYGCTTAFVTTNGGTTWSAIGGYSAGVLHPDQHTFAFMPGSPGTVLVGNDGGILKSTNDGSTWTNLNTGLDTIQFYHVAVSSSGTVLGGAQDNGCNLGKGNAWVQDQSGDGGWVGFNPTNNSIAYCVANGQPFISNDGGVSFSPSSTGINGSGTIGTAPMGADPNNSNVFYFGVKGIIYKTTNDMQNWSSVYSAQAGNVISLAVAPSDSNTVYAGLDNGSVITSANGGASWTLVGNMPNADPASSIVVSPTDSNIMYVAGAAFQSPVILKFNNGVKTNVASSLPNLSVNVLLINQSSLYAGLDSGLYETTIGSNSWSVVASGLPNAAVVDMTISANGTLYAATHGRGIWAVSLASASTTTSQTTNSSTTSTSDSTTSVASTSITTNTTTVVSTSLSVGSSTINSSSTITSQTSTANLTTSSTNSNMTITTSSSLNVLTTTSSLSTNTSTPNVVAPQTTSSSSTSSGGGVPEFPFQAVAVAIFTLLVAGSYLALRRRNSKETT